MVLLSQEENYLHEIRDRVGLAIHRMRYQVANFLISRLRFRPGNVETIDIELVPDTARSPDDQARLREY